MTGNFSQRKARLYLKAGNVCSILLLTATFLTVVLFYGLKQVTQRYLAIAYSASYAIISVFYVVTMLLLRKSLDSFDLKGLQKEKRSVLCQFIFFMIAFIFRTVAYFV